MKIVITCQLKINNHLFLDRVSVLCYTVFESEGVIMTTYDFTYEIAENLGYSKKFCRLIATRADSYQLEPIESNQRLAFRTAIYDLIRNGMI